MSPSVHATTYVCVALALSAAAVGGQAPPEAGLPWGNAEYRMLEVAEARDIDGRLAEGIWADAPIIDTLRQEDPVEGALASEITQVRIVLHGTTLYVGVLALDSNPDGIVSRTLRRDALMEVRTDGRLAFTGDDAVALLIDSDHDGRTASLFATNPIGAEFDAQVSGEGTDVNISWRGIWRVAAVKRSDGWSAEFAIPLRTLRAGSSSDGLLGFNIYRKISRKNEFVLWQSWRRESEGFLRVSRAGRLAGLAFARSGGCGLDIKPFATAGVTSKSAVDDAARRGEWDGGLAVKYEIQPGLVLDGTINADFAQAEADDEQVNLTRFDLFLPEKREFFLENSGIFEFGTRVQGEIPPFLLFFSRRIGVSNGVLLPIRAGSRTSGRAGRQTVGVLHVLTGMSPGDSVTNEPAATHSVVRTKRDVGARGYVGAMFTRTSASTWNNAGGADWSLWPAVR